MLRNISRAYSCYYRRRYILERENDVVVLYNAIRNERHNEIRSILMRNPNVLPRVHSYAVLEMEDYRIAQEIRAMMDEQ